MCYRCLATTTPVADHIIAHGITGSGSPAGEVEVAVQPWLCFACVGDGTDLGGNQCTRCEGTGVEPPDVCTHCQNTRKCPNIRCSRCERAGNHPACGMCSAVVTERLVT